MVLYTYILAVLIATHKSEIGNVLEKNVCTPVAGNTPESGEALRCREKKMLDYMIQSPLLSYCFRHTVNVSFMLLCYLL